MADRDGAAIRVDPAVAEIDFEAAQTGQHLRREGFVDLDHVDVLQRQTGALERMRAIGWAWAASPALRLATIIATAPSLMPDALPAVVMPSLNSGRNLA